MISTIRSLSLHGIESIPIEVEVDVAAGLPNCIIVGLPDTAVSEARDRVRSAIKNSGFSFPKTRVTVNLAPAHVKKVGSLFDLPIALGMLYASGAIQQIPDTFFVGELALDGRLRPIQGALAIAHAAVRKYNTPIFIPAANAKEISLIRSELIFPVESLSQIVAHLRQEEAIAPQSTTPPVKVPVYAETSPRITDIIGQHVAKRAIEIAAAGRHNLLMSGPPGVGKSMLAQSIISILPPLTEQETIEATMLHSLISKQPVEPITHAPFRAPHHSASAISIVGGGTALSPGEISLGHRGVLFFDELPEFRRDVLEVLRQPLETGTMTVSRVNGSVTYPARCLFIAAHNPCPCGYAGVPTTRTTPKHQVCECSPLRIEQYARKLSGPLVDRIDMKIRVPSISQEEMKTVVSTHEAEAQLQQIRSRVQRAHATQQERQGKLNAELSANDIKTHVLLSADVMALLDQAQQHYGLSMRGRSKTIKVARTIADLTDAKEITTQHLAEALQYTVVQQH